jgi:hypothetical protein
VLTSPVNTEQQGTTYNKDPFYVLRIDSACPPWRLTQIRLPACVNAQKARNLLLRRLVHSINAAEVRHLDLFLKFDLQRRFFRALRTSSSENRPSACPTAIRRRCQLPRLPEHTPAIFLSCHQSRSYLVRSAKPLQSAPYSALIFPLQASTKDLIPKSTTVTPLPWFCEQLINQPINYQAFTTWTPKQYTAPIGFSDCSSPATSSLVASTTSLDS